MGLLALGALGTACSVLSGLSDFEIAGDSAGGAGGAGITSGRGASSATGTGGAPAGAGGGGGGGGSPVGWWDETYRSRIKISIDNVAGGEVVDFPVMIQLDAAILDGYDKASLDGADLRFVDGDGQTVLPHEIERWDTAGQSFAWVRVPRIDAGSSEDHLWLYYGNPDAGDIQAPAEVWEGFAGVYHFREGAIALDSVGMNDGAVVGEVGGEPNGRIAGALALSGTGNIALAGVGQFSAYAGDKRTVEVWFRTNNAGHQHVLSQELDCRGYGIEMGLPGQMFQGRFFTSVGNCTGIAEYYVATGNDVLTDGEWHYAALVIDRPLLLMALLVDGSMVATSPINLAASAVSDQAWIGSAFNDQDRFNGSIDEVRVSTSSRSGTWIAAQYRSMRNELTSFGKAEHLPAP
jgi:biopolymer transport protein ExbB